MTSLDSLCWVFECRAQGDVLIVQIYWLGYSGDHHDRWTPEHSSRIEECIAKDDPTIKPLDKYHLHSVAFDECIEILEKVGSLAKVNLILPQAFIVSSIGDLSLDGRKFKGPPSITIIDLDTTNRISESRRSLQ